MAPAARPPSQNVTYLPPLLAIEIDIKTDDTTLTETGYPYKKNRKLFDFGIQRVLWVLTEAQVVIIATPNQIETVDRNTDIELLTGHTINIGAYLIKKSINVI